MLSKGAASRLSVLPAAVGSRAPAWIVAVAIAAAAYAPLLIELTGWLWSRQHYQFFPFVIAAATGLLAYRWKQSPSGSGLAPTWLSGVAVALAALTLFVAVWLYSPLVAGASVILFVAAPLAELARERHIAAVWSIWALLWLVLPLPLGTDYQLITFLQLFSSRLSSTALDAIGVLHLMEGNTLLLVNKQLFVDEACSGIVSVMSIVACAAIYGVWQNRSLLHIVLLALLGIVWATLMNVLRIVIIAFVLNTWNIDWSAGTAHELLGLVLFLLAFAALATSDQLLLALLGPIEVAWLETTGHGLRYGRWLIRGFDRTASWGEPSRRPRLVDEHRHGEPSGIAVPVVAAVLFAALGLYQLALPSPTDRASAPVDELSDPNIARAMQIDRQSLPSSLLGLRCVDFRSEHRDSQHIMGEHSQVFSFSDQANLPVLVSCDFAYPGGWHELSVCYRGIGWELLSRRIVVPDTSASDRRWPIVELVLRKPDGSFAAVLFCAFDDKGQPIEPPAETLSESFETALSRRKQKSPRGNCFQVQVLLSSPTLPTGERLATGTQLLTAARQQLRDTIIDNKAGTAGTTDEP